MEVIKTLFSFSFASFSRLNGAPLMEVIKTKLFFVYLARPSLNGAPLMEVIKTRLEGEILRLLV